MGNATVFNQGPSPICQPYSGLANGREGTARRHSKTRTGVDALTSVPTVPLAELVHPRAGSASQGIGPLRLMQVDSTPVVAGPVLSEAEMFSANDDCHVQKGLAYRGERPTRTSRNQRAIAPELPVARATYISIVRPTVAAAFERRKEMYQMGPTEPLTAPAADAAHVLESELRQLFKRDGIVDLQERRALKLARALTLETNRVDANVRVIVSGFRVDGLRSGNFRRKLREFDRDWEPDPAGPAAAGVIVNEEAA